MITGFNEITKQLTESEMKLVPNFVKNLSKKFGKENVISNKQIRKAYLNTGQKLSDARVRKIINYIRINGLVKNLVSNSRGYYIASNRKEVEEYTLSLLERENAIKQVRIALLNQLNK